VGDMRWWQVAIKPAKPFAFGLARGVPVFGLPGNPVSSHVSYELFARPGLRVMAGDPNPLPPVVPAVAGSALRRRPDGKLHLDRVHVVREGDALVATRTGDQASNVLSAMALANGLALLPDGDGVPAGGAVDVVLLDLPPGGADPVALAEGAGSHRHDVNDC
jgi:molybdopterin molybdotransferase